MKKTVTVRGRKYWRAAKEFDAPIKRKPRTLPEKLKLSRSDWARIERLIDASVGQRMAGVKATVAGRSRRGGCC